MCKLNNKIAALGEFKESTSRRIPLAKTLLLILAFLVLINSTLLASQEMEPRNIIMMDSCRPTSPIEHQETDI